MVGRLWRMWRALALPSRLAHGRRAVVFVEFALVGPPFLFCLVFMVELGYDLYAQEILDYGMQNAARQIQIGGAQSVTTPGQFIKDCLCPIVTGLLDCTSLAVNVGPVTDYYAAYTSGSISEGIPVVSGKLNTTAFTYNGGSQNALMLATVVYTSPSLVAAFVPSMAISNGSTFVKATFSASAFVNENFTVATSSSCCAAASC